MKIELNALINEWASYNINLRNLSENSVKAYSLDLKDFLHFSFQESQPVLKSDLSNISSHTIRCMADMIEAYFVNRTFFFSCKSLFSIQRTNSDLPLNG